MPLGNIWNRLGGTQAVYVNSYGKLGLIGSSRRFKEDIEPMDKASEALLALKPVRFRYNKEIDPAGTSQFGLVAEDVEKVNPDLVVRDKEGKPYSVRYDAVNAMLLNEFLKERRTVQELKSTAAKQEATIAELKSTVEQQQRGIEALTAGLRRVSAQLAAASPSDGGLEASKPAPQRLRTTTKGVGFVEYWEIIADRLSKAGWSLGSVSAIDSQGRTVWITPRS